MQMNRRYWKLYRMYEKWIHQQADHSFFITEADRQYAMANFDLPLAKCTTVPYGVKEIKSIGNARQQVIAQYNIRSAHLLYFNGTLDYLPNKKAVEWIIGQLDPALQKRQLDYQIIISGKKLSWKLQSKIRLTKTITYLRFVENVEWLYQASSIFINAVVNNSGVKTKVVEALANNCTVVSMQTGAAGIPAELYNGKMFIVKDNDSEAFAESIIQALSRQALQTPEAFFDYFSWKNIAKKAAKQIDELTNVNA
jgi:glycosyltransferase involved in cell wall biosynthesis